jgi:hypothetical protein
MTEPTPQRPRKRSRKAPEGAENVLRLSSVDRGRLMAQTAASAATINAWWKGEGVKPITARALEQAARRLRILVPYPATERLGAKV